MANFEFITSKRGKEILLECGFQHYFQKRYKNGQCLWLCKQRRDGCCGSITLKGNKIEKRVHHTCEADEAKNQVDLAMNRAKKRAREETTSVPTIFEEEMVSILDKGLEFVATIPTFQGKKTSPYKARHEKFGNVTFKHRRDVKFSESMEPFILFDDGEDDKIIGCMSTFARKNFEKYNTFFLDGTFKSCCPQFGQLYSIHADIGSTATETNVLPLFYALLPDKKEITYVRMFEILKAHFPNWKPTYVKVNFEQAVITAMKKSLPNVKISGCNFHFGQCLWRKVQELGLTRMYTEREEVRRHIRMCASLAHIPPSEIENGWIIIMETYVPNEQLDKFNDYFVETWLDNGPFGYIWNCYGERHRTTNTVEGWHSRLNRRINKPNPNIVELLITLQKDGQNMQLQSIQIQHHATPKRRKTKFVAMDERLHKIVADFKSFDIDLLQCSQKFQT